MPKLIAKERFYYSGRNLEAGEEFEATEQDVALLTNSVSPRASKPDVAADVAEEPAAPRRQYKRRDMKAEG